MGCPDCEALQDQGAVFYLRFQGDSALRWTNLGILACEAHFKAARALLSRIEAGVKP